jgi:hypothetical protein
MLPNISTQTSGRSKQMKINTPRENRFLGLTVCALIALGTWACDPGDSGSNVSDTVGTVSDNTADFSSYSTFMLVEPPADAEKPPVSLPEGERLALNKAIIAEMEALGHTRVTVDADLLVASFIRVETVDTTVSGYWYEYYYGYYWGYDYIWYEEDEIEVDVGTVIVDAVDTVNVADDKDDRLVFRGVAMGLVGEGDDDSSSRIVTAVGLIFDEWPKTEVAK